MNTNYIPTEEELTAYVLGECDDLQTKEIEVAVASHAETAELLEAIRETVELSAGLFSAVSDETLSDAQRAEVTSAAENVVPLKTKKPMLSIGEAVAAIALLGIGAGLFFPALSRSRGLDTGWTFYAPLSDSGEVTEVAQSEPVPFKHNRHTDVNGIDESRYTVPAAEPEEWFPDDELPSASAGNNFADASGGKDDSLSTITEFATTTPKSESKPKPLDKKQVDKFKYGGGVSHGNSNQRQLPESVSSSIESLKLLPEGADGTGIKPYESNIPTIENDSAQPAPVAAAPPVPRNAPMRTARAGGEGSLGVNGGSAAHGGTPSHFYNRAGVGGNVPELKEQSSQTELYSLGYVGKPTDKKESKYSNDNSGTVMEFGFEDKYVIAPQKIVDINGNGVAEEWDSSRNERKQIASAPPQDIYRPVPKPQPITPGTEAYDRIIENKFKRVAQDPLSTFSIDVDTASYSNMRRFLSQGQMPPVDSVRVEELINYFNYDYPQPKGDDPFSANIEVASAPWNPQHKLVRVGLKGKDIVSEERPASNLVFLLDVSGSMSAHNKLPLVKQSIQMLTKQLTDRDRVAIVVYAGNSGLVLPSTPGNRHGDIVSALERLNAGGSTNGGAGIELAYRVASENFIKGGVNRVILATDGDFNVGNTSRGGLVGQIESSAKTGVFLSVLGFGMGNLKDATMENLADKGNGNYAYIDTFHEAKKVLVDQMNGTLYTIAKDVKIQVEFNPNRVQSYRLIGYENRALANRDFNDDTKDAGEIGAGHTVTALYELVPKGVSTTMPQRGVDSLRYQSVQEKKVIAKPLVDGEFAQELMTVKLRYKQPDEHTSKLLEFHVGDVNADYNEASKDFQFASAVAVFGMKLRNSPFAQHMSYDQVLQMANNGMGHDLNGYRTEFTGLVRKVKSMNPQPVYYPEEVIR